MDSYAASPHVCLLWRRPRLLPHYLSPNPPSRAEHLFSEKKEPAPGAYTH